MCQSLKGDSIFLRNYSCKKCEGNIGEAVELEEKLCVVATVSAFTYLGDRVSAGGGCEAAVTATTRYGLVSLGSAMSCMAGFSLMLKGAFSKSFVKPAMLH